MTTNHDHRNDPDSVEDILAGWDKAVREADLTMSLLLDAKRNLQYEQAVPVDQIDVRALRQALIEACAPFTDNKPKVANLCAVLTNIPMLEVKPDA
jgi:hypothetical protein